MQAARTEQVGAASKETLEVIVRSITDSFARCSPFSESLLLVAFKANPEEVQRVLTKSCKKVLSAPIRKDEYEWFLVCVYMRTRALTHSCVHAAHSNTCSLRRCGCSATARASSCSRR